MAWKFVDVNFILDTPFVKQESDAKLFGMEPFSLLPSNATMLDALVAAGIFESKGQARKNWQRETVIPEGFSEWLDIGKARSRITILNIVRDIAQG